MFYLDVGEIVRFRVETEEWHDQIPNAPDLGEEIATERKPAYSIFVRSSGSVFSMKFPFGYRLTLLSRARCRSTVSDLSPGGEVFLWFESD